jgi:hypothetical protein
MTTISSARALPVRVASRLLIGSFEISKVWRSVVAAGVQLRRNIFGRVIEGRVGPEIPLANRAGQHLHMRTQSSRGWIRGENDCLACSIGNPVRPSG